jgi:predicted nuclease of predicted toxin-antitoxin system
MKLLLDENLPKRLKKDFPEHEIYHIRDKGWNGIGNGKFLELMISEKFDALLTFDRNLRYQQNFKKYSITVFVLNAPDNSYQTLNKLVPIVKEAMKASLLPGPIEIKQK